MEALVNDSLWHAVRDAAAAGEPYRESTEIKYLCEATDLIEKLKHLVQDGQPVRLPSFELSEVVFVERQR